MGILDAPTLVRTMELFTEALRRHRDELNSLNVYPVPDGDTGTNMLLTQEAVERELASLDGSTTTLGTLGTAISRASLVAARGNSGVILSQVLRGLCERMPPDGTVRPGQLAAALEHASAEADRAVARPADGTVLSVLRDAARAAVEVAPEADDCASVMDAVLEAARRSLARTREVLPELRQAGVVDAGAKGVVLLFDALHAALRDEPLSEPVGPPGPVGRRQAEDERRPDLEFAFEVQYLLETDDDRVTRVRRRLGEIGDSVVVVGGGGLYNVHVHTNEPGQAVEIGVESGRPRTVSILHLEDGVTDCIGGHARAVRVAEQASALVVVAEGEGLAGTFRSLGALVVPGGPDTTPSVAELVEAVEAVPAQGVLLLPNHPSVVPAAERAAAESRKEVRVVRSLSVPAGLAAATAFNPVAGLEENIRSAQAASESCRAGEVARAEPGLATGLDRAGEWVGLSEGRVVARGGDPAVVAAELGRALADDRSEIVTLVTGEEATDEEAAGVARALEAALPGMDIEVVSGGQPGHPYLIGAE